MLCPVLIVPDRHLKEGRSAMSELDELVKSPGVLMAGRFGPDGRIAEQKTTKLFVERQPTADMVVWFCSAITALFGSVAFAVDSMNRSAFDQTSWLPVTGWTYTGGDYGLVVRGTLFVFAERAKIRSIDELSGLIHEAQP
jgi:roadblock/LC7 domain-containing protein